MKLPIIKDTFVNIYYNTHKDKKTSQYQDEEILVTSEVYKLIVDDMEETKRLLDKEIKKSITKSLKEIDKAERIALAIFDKWNDNAGEFSIENINKSLTKF